MSWWLAAVVVLSVGAALLIIWPISWAMDVAQDFFLRPWIDWPHDPAVPPAVEAEAEDWDIPDLPGGSAQTVPDEQPWVVPDLRFRPFK